MRIKAVPEEAMEFAAKHPWVIATIAVIGAGGYLYYNAINNPVPDADVSANADPVYGSYGFAPLSTGGIVSASGSIGGTGIVDSVSNTAALDAMANAAAQVGKVSEKDLFDFEKTKNDQSNALQWAQLNANIAIARTNADLAWQGIQASNYSASAQLAQSFLMSGAQVAMGTMTDPNGQSYSFGFTQYKPTGTKKLNKQAATYAAALNSSGFNEYFANSMATTSNNTGAVQNAALPSSGSSTIAAYASRLVAAPVQSSGSGVASSVNAGNDNGFYLNDVYASY